MRTLLVVPMALALLGAATGSTAAQGTTDDGFASPEEAITAYLGGVAAGDLEQVLAASAIKEMASGFRFDLQADRLGAFLPVISLGPADDPLFVALNEARQTASLTQQIQLFTYDLLSDATIDGTVIAPVDAAWAETFAAQVDPARLAGIAIEDIRFSNAELEQNERYLENAARQAAVYGADEQTERLVLFAFEGDLYDLGFTLLRYGDGWKVASQVAPLAGTSSLGTARPTTAEDYDVTTSGGG